LQATHIVHLPPGFKSSRWISSSGNYFIISRRLVHLFKWVGETSANNKPHEIRNQSR